MSSTHKAPLVSIVTPSFNQAEFIEATIQSVLTQDYPHIEYIVIDGGSTDGTLEILHEYANRFAYWTSEPDSGQTEAINKGFDRASGDILAWLNSDDLYRPNAVSEAVAYLEEHPEVGMVYGDVDYVDENGQIVGRFPAAQTDYKRLRRGYVHIPQQASFFRARLWRMVGPIDPSLYFAMDYYLWTHIAAVTPIRYHQSTWAAFRLHDEAKTFLAADRSWPEMLQVHRQMGGGVFSLLQAKYVIRRLVEPIMPFRLKLRLLTYAVKSRWNSVE